MDKMIKLKRPGVDVGDSRELTASFELPPFDLYGRRHEVSGAKACVRVTRLSEGLHLDLEVVCEVSTTCDRTLDLMNLTLSFGESEFLSGPNDRELYVEDWELNVSRYTREALSSEVPMQVFAPGTKPVSSADKGEGIDPRWRGLDDLFASGF